MLIQRATLLDGSAVDIRVDAHVREVADHLSAHRGEDVLDAAHATVLPGLHDHHVHLHSAAAALSSVRIGPREAVNREALHRILTTARVGADGWIRAIGYHEEVAGPLDRHELDTVTPAVPVRVQHRSGVLWTLNSAGLARVGLADHPTGRLRSADPHWSESLQRRESGLAEVSRELASYGVTGVTDATPDLSVEDFVKFAEAHRHGEVLQRMRFLAPGKRILHDYELDLHRLTHWIRHRHDASGTVALHCVTAAQLVVSIAALQAAGVRNGDRIEHAAVVPEDCLVDLAALGVTVVTQPNFVAERGDQYLTDVPSAEHAELWRLATLLDANIPVAMSTDLPFGGADPWAAMRAAVGRTTASGAVLGARERISARTALTMFLADVPGDACIVSGSPDDVLADLDATRVAATIVEGRVVYERS